MAALKGLGPADLLAAVGTRRIAREAGVSPSTFFHHFPSLDDFAAAVVTRLYSPDQVWRSQQIARRIKTGIAGLLPVETAYVLHGSDFDRLRSDPEFRLRIGLWALGGPLTTRVYRNHMSAVDEATVPAAERLFENWGREFRPPFDSFTFVAAQTALLQGFVIRNMLHPAVSRPHYQRAAAALTMVMLRVKGDRRTLDDRLAEINYYPVDLALARPPSPSARSKRDALLAAAEELFEARGFEDTSIAAVARRAGTSESTVYEHFQSKAGLGIALLNREAAESASAGSEPGGELGAGTSGDAVARLLAHLLALAAIAMRRSHTRAYLAALACHDPIDRNADWIRARTAELVADAQATGALSNLRHPDDVATMLLIVVLSTALGSPAGGAEGAVESAWTALAPALLKAGRQPE